MEARFVRTSRRTQIQRSIITYYFIRNWRMKTGLIDKDVCDQSETKMRSKPISLPMPPTPPRHVVSKTSLKLRRFIDLAADAAFDVVKRLRAPIPWVSQCGQDRFVVEKIFRRKRRGFFLEIGGGDGRYLSNKLILERYFDWSGILVEPTGAFEAMVKSRPNAICVHAAIAGSRKTLRLTEILDKGQIAMNPEAAHGNTLLSVTEDADGAKSALDVPVYGSIQKSYLVEAITLDDLLTKSKAPSTIDYFSFDVEGSEYEILKEFPFEKWKFNCIGVETPSTELNQLLVSNNYLLIREGIPLDWFYLHRDFLDEWFEKMN
jgi:FkbM family methyltransferase